jgi:dTDP-glucose 4,6-dehydratase
VLASTSEVYGEPLEHPQREEYWGNVNPVGPRSMYDEAKRFAEALTTAYISRRGVRGGIVRIFNTYGPGMRSDDGRVVPAFVTQALAGLPLVCFGDGSQTRSLCHVDDLVRGLLAMVDCEATGPINLGNPQEVTIAELAALVIKLSGSASRIEYAALPADDPTRRCPDISRAQRELGFQPSIDLEAGLAAVIARQAAGGDAPG